MTAITDAWHVNNSTGYDYYCGDIGPFIDGNDNLYVVAEAAPSGSATDRIGVFRSTDNGSTWSEIDSANRPTAIANGLQAFTAFLDGTVLHVGTMGGESGGMTNTFDIEYQTFNTSDAGSQPDTWQIKNEAVASPEVESLNNQGLDMAVRSDGDVIIAHQIPDASIMGNTYDVAGYSRREGGSWTSNVALFSGEEQNQRAPNVALGTNDRIHFLFTSTNDGTRGVTLRPDNTLSTAINPFLNAPQQLLTYNEGGTQHIIAFYKASGIITSHNMVESANDIADTGNSHSIEDTANTIFQANSRAAYISGDDETYYAYLDSGLPGFGYETRTAEGSWGNRTLLYNQNEWSTWWHYHASVNQVAWVYCQHNTSPALELNFDSISLGAPVDFNVEQATEVNTAFDVNFTDPTEFTVDFASEKNIGYDVKFEAGLAINVEQATEKNAAIDVEFFAGDPPPEGFIILASTTSSEILVSEDGENWTERPQNETTRSLRQVTSSDSLELFVIGTSGSGESSATVLTTDDTFAYVEETVSSGAGYTVGATTWSPSEAIFCVARGNRPFTSPDGSTWTQRDLPRYSSLGDLIWADGISKFLLGQDVFEGTLTKGINTSPDGITWTAVGPSSYNSFYGAFAWSDDLTLAVCIDTVGDFVYTSPDGTNWTYRQTLDPPASSVAWGPDAGRYVAVGNNGVIWSSTNGTSWSQETSPTTVNLSDVEWISYLDFFCAVGATTIITSPDGQNWTEQSVPAGIAGTIVSVWGGVSNTDIFNAEYTTEENEAFDVKFQNTTEFLADFTSEENVAYDVEFETPNVVLIQETIQLSLDTTITATVVPPLPAQGLGVPKRGDHKPAVYHPDHNIVKR